MLEVTAAEYADEYRIQVTFNDGAHGVVDLSDSLWGPMFEPLRNLDNFRRFEVSQELHTICWSNHADLAPEYLYQKLLAQNKASEPHRPQS